jgi:hypothetical protein
MATGGQTSARHELAEVVRDLPVGPARRHLVQLLFHDDVCGQGTDVPSY